MLPDDQVHPDTHVLTKVNNVIEVVNYVIAARPSPLNSVIADTARAADGLIKVVMGYLPGVRAETTCWPRLGLTTST